MMIMQGDNFIECSNEQSYQWFTHRLVSQPWQNWTDVIMIFLEDAVFLHDTICGYCSHIAAQERSL